MTDAILKSVAVGAAGPGRARYEHRRGVAMCDVAPMRHSIGGDFLVGP